MAWLRSFVLIRQRHGKPAHYAIWRTKSIYGHGTLALEISNTSERSPVKGERFPINPYDATDSPTDTKHSWLVRLCLRHPIQTQHVGYMVDHNVIRPASRILSRNRNPLFMIWQFDARDPRLWRVVGPAKSCQLRRLSDNFSRQPLWDEPAHRSGSFWWYKSLNRSICIVKMYDGAYVIAF